jgi:diketogulonate reductase-like aldo/keto reductase
MTNARTASDLTVKLAGSGAEMPLLGLGTWQLRGERGRQAVGWALEAGYRHIDTATMYGNEAEVGAAVTASGLDRAEVFITTKMPPERAGGRELRTLQDSLRALGTDYVDLWLVHWPPHGGADVGAWRAFIRAQRDGLARAIGVSNYSIAQIDRLLDETGVLPAVNQIRWSPFRFDPRILEASGRRNVVLEGYSPFKAGRLDHPTITEIAARYGKTPAQIVVRWHLQHEIVVIPKSARRERIQANADVFDFELTAADMALLDGLSGGR